MALTNKTPPELTVPPVGKSLGEGNPGRDKGEVAQSVGGMPALSGEEPTKPTGVGASLLCMYVAHNKVQEMEAEGWTRTDSFDDTYPGLFSVLMVKEDANA